MGRDTFHKARLLKASEGAAAAAQVHLYITREVP